MVTGSLSSRSLRPLLIAALIGLGWWFFGNLYEAIVISPNWVIDSPAQLTRLHGFFQVTSPTNYFVPATPLALVALWIALYLGRTTLPRPEARLALWLSLALAGLTVAIVTVLINTLFGAHFLDRAAQLSGYAWWWNVANLARLALTGGCAVLVWRMLHSVRAIPNRAPTQ